VRAVELCKVNGQLAKKNNRAVFISYIYYTRHERSGEGKQHNGDELMIEEEGRGTPFWFRKYYEL
jgi:hypothetical protein